MSLQVFLRVLYTVNSSPQYILAKSSAQVKANKCSEAPDQSPGNGPVHARAPLKACIVAVCDSSPELLQDPARDFSLYVLDPLEAQPSPMHLTHAPHKANSPQGVAVALGLMSWALESNASENVFVTGTIIPSDSLALEVVFALRETKRIPKPIFHMYPSLGPLPTHASQASVQPSGTNWIFSSHSQQERQTLTRSADFPELYIGPPRRARGRPEGSTSSKSREAEGVSLSATGPSEVTERRNVSRPRHKTRAKPRPPRVPPVQPPFIRAPLAHHASAGGADRRETNVAASNQQTDGCTQNHFHSEARAPLRATPNPLFELLSAISSTSSGGTATATPEQQATLLSALQGLLAGNPQLSDLTETKVERSARNGGSTTSTDEKPIDRGCKMDNEPDEGDPDIVILDSSAVDTTAFRRRNSLKLVNNDHKLLAANQNSPMLSSQRADPALPSASALPSQRANGPISSEISALTIMSGTETPTSNPISVEQMGRANTVASHVLHVPATPTASHIRKRKLDEYIHDQVNSSMPLLPSPSMPRTSGSVRAVDSRHQGQSLPTNGTKLPSTRLPSMLGSMRATGAIDSCLHVRSSSSSSDRPPPTSTTGNSGNPSSALASGHGKVKMNPPRLSDTSLSDIVSDKNVLKRRRTLSEFMAECEARQSTKIRKRSSGCQSGTKLSGDASHTSATRPTKAASTSNNASSPPRPLFRSDSMVSSLLASTIRPGSVPFTTPSNSLCSSKSMASTTSAAFPSTAAPTNNPLKNFVLPAWARTDTAMLPRLSEEALARLQAERDTKKAEASLRRREAAKAKRKRLLGARPSKESSEEEDGEVLAVIARSRMLHPPISSNTVQTADSATPLSLLPVFASDGLEPIVLSSPPRSNRPLAPAVVPSTPPRKVTSSATVTHRTPSKSGSFSLFTPSGQDVASLFTPTTPSVTRSLKSLNRVTFTPRSPTLLRHSSAEKPSRKNVPQTPRRSSGYRQTPWSGRVVRSGQLVSPNLGCHASQSRPGVGQRAFLLPPPSPCPARSSCTPKDRLRSLSDKPAAEDDKGKGRDVDKLSYELDDSFREVSIPTRPIEDKDRTASELCDTPSSYHVFEAEEESASSPLPPSSPLALTPLSSPAMRQCSDGAHPRTPTTDDLAVPSCKNLFPTASDPEGAPSTTLLPLLSDDDLDHATSAWLTETDAWLTDTEGDPLPADSDGAWLSDSDAIFGDMSSLPPSTASNWLSDDADIDTDGDFFGTAEAGESDTAALEKALAALAEHAEQDAGKNKDVDSGGATSQAQRTEIDSEFWDSIRPLLGLGASDATTASVDTNENESVYHNPDLQGKVVQDMQELWDKLAGSSPS